MKNTFFGKNNEDVVLKRSFSHGYKELVVKKELEIGSVIDFVTEGSKLVMQKTEGTFEYGKDKITFLCKSFGLANNDPAKISVIFCDDGDMLITLHEGTLYIKHEDSILQPVVGSGSYGSVNASDILWIDEDRLLSGKSYFGDKLQCMNWQDFEYIFEVRGGKDKAGCEYFSVKLFRDEFIDLSLGYTATVREEMQRRERQATVDSIASMCMNFSHQEADMDLDIEDDYAEDEYGDFDDEESFDLGV